VNSNDHLRQASTFVISLKKATAPGATLQPLDTNQETLSLREARSQKRKATSPTPQEEELDQEIRDLEAINQQVQKKREKMLRLADLQRKIDEATEEMRHLLRMTKTEGPNTGSFVKKALSMMMNGTMTFIMVTLLLMMLLL
jgi:type I site-specific restriction endonuclease